MPTVLLVRHGQASFGTDDYDRLSALGRHQAEIVAAALTARGLNIQWVLSGSLRRQRETAAPLAERVGRDVEVDDRWNEYAMEAIIAAHSTAPARAAHSDASAQTTHAEALPSHGGTSPDRFQDLLDDALRHWIEAGAGTTAQTSWPEFRDRTAAALDELAASLGPGQTGVAFTSGGVIAALCARQLGGGPDQLLQLNRVAVNAAITKIAAGRRGLTLISINDHSHLERPGSDLITYR